MIGALLKKPQKLYPSYCILRIILPTSVKCGLLIVELYPSYLQSIEVVLKSKMETEHLINENDEQLSSNEPNLPLLGSAKFQRQLEK